MKLWRGILWAGAAVFIGIGLMFLVAPARWAATVDIALPTAMARTDLRATYGGLDVGVGIFLAFCAARPAWLEQGLLALGLTALGFASGRTTGIIVEGGATPLMGVFLATEVLSAVVSFYGLRRVLRPGSARSTF